MTYQKQIPTPSMRAYLKPKTVERLESIIGKRLTTGIDADINHALDLVKKKRMK